MYNETRAPSHLAAKKYKQPYSRLRYTGTGPLGGALGRPVGVIGGCGKVGSPLGEVENLMLGRKYVAY